MKMAIEVLRKFAADVQTVLVAPHQTKEFPFLAAQT